MADSLCRAIGIDFISKVDGVLQLLERVDALLPPDTASQTWVMGQFSGQELSDDTA